MENRGRIGLRIVAALIIAGIGIFVYMHHVEENPVTGEKQHVSLSSDQEIVLGLKAAPTMAEKMGGEVDLDDPRARVVQNVGSYLVENTIAKRSPWKFQFHLLADNETVNAFALPGGQIFITLGLLNKLSNEAELAGVLGHEMGHVIERHTAEHMAKSQLGQSMVIAVGTATSDRSSVPLMIAAMVNEVIQLRYGRKDELQSDEWGIKLLEQARFNPSAMVKVMEILKAQSDDESLDFFKTHPNPDLRTKDIKAYLEKNPPPAGLSDGRPLEELYRNPNQMP